MSSSFSPSLTPGLDGPRPCATQPPSFVSQARCELIAMHIKPFLAVAALSLTATGYSQSTNKWETSAALGLTLTKGNSDTLMVTADALTAKKFAHDELSFGASL